MLSQAHRAKGTLLNVWWDFRIYPLPFRTPGSVRTSDDRLQYVHNATDDAAIIGSFETEYFRPQVRFVKSCFRSRQTGVPSRAKSLY